MDLVVPGRSLVRALTAVTVVLVVLNAVVIAVRFTTGHDHLLGFAPLFQLRSEANVPTWFASILHAIAAILLALCGLHARSATRGPTRTWFMLAAIFACFSLDETVMLHELLNRVRLPLVEPSGYLTFAWVVPGALFTVVVALLSVRLLRSLPRDIARRFVLAGAIFVAGALGFELLGAAHVSQSQSLETLEHFVLSSIEETLELAGLLVFIAALLRYLAQEGVRLGVRLPGTERPPAAVVRHVPPRHRPAATATMPHATDGPPRAPADDAEARRRRTPFRGRRSS